MSRNRKNGFELFSNALKAIGYDVELVGDIPEEAIEKAVVLRYGHLCYMIHRTYKSNNTCAKGTFEESLKSIFTVGANCRRTKNSKNEG